MDLSAFSEDFVIQTTKKDLIQAFKEVIKDVQSMEVKTWFSIKQASDYLGYSVPSIYKMVHKNEIPHYKRTGKLMFLRSELEEWLNTYKVI